MALKFSMVLQAVDRVTAPARRVRTAVGGMTAGIRQFAQQMRRTSQDVQSGARSLEYYQTRARRMRQVALERIFRAAAASARQLAANVRAGVRSLDLMGRAGRAAKSGLSWMWEKAAGLAKWGAAGAIAGGGLALFDMFGTASKFEQFNIMLTGMEGSADKARKAMSWVQDFAQKTPYELDDVMGAFVKLKGYGIDPMNGSLAALGDGAAGMSKPIDQAVEALADAMTNSYERLKEFGIRANTVGKQVTFTYMKNGKEIRRQVKANAAEVEKAITGIFSDRFGGMMDRQSTTFAGLISNLKDTWAKFLLMVADAGIFERVKTQLAELYDWVNKLAQNGTLKVWAQQISDWLGQAFDWAVDLVKKTDWKALANDVADIAKAAKVLADAVLSIAENWKRVNAVIDMTPLGTIRSAAQSITGWVTGGGKPPARPSAPAQWPTPAGQSPRAPGSMLMRAPAIAKPQASAGQVQVGGRLQIDLKTAPGTSARVSKVAAVGPMPVVVNLGQSMGAPA